MESFNNDSLLKLMHLFADRHSEGLNESHPNKLFILPLSFVVTCMGLIDVVGVLGNAVVVWIVVKKRRMQSYTNWMLLNLAVSDLAVTLFCIPLDIPLLIKEKWIYGKFFCSVYYPIGTAALLCSVFTLVNITYTRYWAIAHPFRQQPKIGIAKVSIMIMWSFSVLLVIPLIVVLKYDGQDEVCYESWSHKSRSYYTITIFMLGYALPLSIITIGYALIVYEVTCKGDITFRDEHVRKENRALIKLSVAVSITFGVCVLPNQLVFLLFEFGDLGEYKYNVDLMIGSHLMLFLHCAINPIIYNVFSENFRRGFRDLNREFLPCLPGTPCLYDDRNRTIRIHEEEICLVNMKKDFAE